jgi:hypothetical protein
MEGRVRGSEVLPSSRTCLPGAVGRSDDATLYISYGDSRIKYTGWCQYKRIILRRRSRTR